MYDDLEFAQPRLHEATSFKELSEVSADRFLYQSQMVETKDISISDNGLLIVEGAETPLLQTAFVDLCKRLRIPDPFASNIPWDLLQLNINTLAIAREKGVQLFLRDDGVIANVATETFIPIPHDKFLDSLQEGAPEITRGFISDTGLQIDIVSPKYNSKEMFKDLTVKKGDVVRSGLSFMNSTSGYHFTKAMLFLWRLICTNGMVLPTKIGSAKMRTKPTRDVDISVNNFLHQVAQLMMNSKSVENRLKDMNRHIDSEEFSRYWKGLSKIHRDDTFLEEEVFEVYTRGCPYVNGKA